jgi:hypothetical protein
VCTVVTGFELTMLITFVGYAELYNFIKKLIIIFVKTYVVSQVTVLEIPLLKSLKCLLQDIQVSCVAVGHPLDMTLRRIEGNVLCPLNIQSILDFGTC